MFDPYAKWLGIAGHDTKPNHYQLLGLSLDVDDADVIANAADMRMAHVRTFQIGEYARASQRLLNELSQARVCLLDPQRRAAYRATLNQETPLPAPAPIAPQAAAAAQERPLAAPADSEPGQIDASRKAKAPAGSRKRPGPPSAVPMRGGAKRTSQQSGKAGGLIPFLQKNKLGLAISGGMLALVVIAAALLSSSRRDGESVLNPHVAATEPASKSSSPAASGVSPTSQPSASLPVPPSLPAPPAPPPQKKEEPKPPISTPPVPNIKARAESIPANVRYANGEDVDLLPYVGQEGDVIRLTGPPACEFRMTATGLQKAAGTEELQAALIPLPVGRQLAKTTWRQEDYRLSATLTPGSPGAMFLSFPVADKQFVAFIGGAGRKVGFAIEPVSVSDAVRKDVGVLNKGQVYEVEISVEVLADGREAKITVQLDGFPVINWQGSLQGISPDNSITSMQGQDQFVMFGFGAQQDIGAELHEFKIQSHASAGIEPAKAQKPDPKDQGAMGDGPAAAGVAVPEASYFQPIDYTQCKPGYQFEGRVEGYKGAVTACAISPNGKLAATSHFVNVSGAITLRAPAVFIWDATGRKKSSRLIASHGDYVDALAFSPNGKLLATGSRDSTVRLWSPTTGKQMGQLNGHTKGVNSIAFSPDGKWLASGSSDQSIRIWDVAKERSNMVLTGALGKVVGVAFSADGSMLASAGTESPIVLWDVATGAQKEKLGPTISGGFASVAFSGNGQWLAAGGRDRRVRVWDAKTRQQKIEFSSGEDCAIRLALSPDGGMIAFIASFQPLLMFELPSGRPIAQSEPQVHVDSLTISVDGRIMGTGGSSGIARLWHFKPKE